MLEINFEKPVCGLIDTDGNVFSLLGRTNNRLKKLGLEQDSKELQYVVMSYSIYGSSDSTRNTLFLFSDVVTIVSEAEQHMALEGVPEAKQIYYAGFSEAHLYAMKNKFMEDREASFEDISYEMNSDNCYNRTPIFYAISEKIANEFIENEEVDLLKQDMWSLTPVEFTKKSEVAISLLKKMTEKNIFETWANSDNNYGNRLSYVVKKAEHFNNEKFMEDLLLFLKNTIYENKKIPALNNNAKKAIFDLSIALIDKSKVKNNKIKEYFNDFLPEIAVFYDLDSDKIKEKLPGYMKEQFSEKEKLLSKDYLELLYNKSDKRLSPKKVL